MTDPRLDPLLTIRIHPDDLPTDPGARRVIRHALAGPGVPPRPWLVISGIWPWPVIALHHREVHDWPVQRDIEPVVAATCPYCGRSTADDDHIKIFSAESKLPHKIVCPQRMKDLKDQMR